MPRQRAPAYFEKLTGTDAFDKLRFYARHFAAGRYNCVVFVGPPGRLKSSIIERETKGRAHVISCHATPFDVFCQAQAHTDRMLVLDDADGLYADAQGQRLMKALTNPRKPTTVAWNSSAPEQVGLLKSFPTSSKVCVIDNAWNVQNEHIEALEDRARLFLFAPPPLAVHKQMALEEWFYDDEIYDFVGRHLYWIKHEFDPKTPGVKASGKGLSVRLYVKAQEAKEAGEDWRQYVLSQYIDNPADVAFLTVEADPYFKDKPVEEKAQAWMTRTGLARSTYFDHKKLLLARLVADGADVDLLGRLSLGK